RRDRLRPVPHTGVLRAAAPAHGQPPAAPARRDPALRRLCHRCQRAPGAGSPDQTLKAIDMKTINRLLPLVAALVLAGCATALPSLPPTMDTPPQFKEQPRQNEHWTIAQPAEAQSRGTWWKAFNDPVLDALVERAGAGNTGIQEAVARLAQARALVRGASADRTPQIGLGAAADRGTGTSTANGSAPGTLLQAGVNLSYEVDLFGRLSRTQDAAALDAP